MNIIHIFLLIKNNKSHTKDLENCITKVFRSKHASHYAFHDFLSEDGAWTENVKYPLFIDQYTVAYMDQLKLPFLSPHAIFFNFSASVYQDED